MSARAFYSVVQYMPDSGRAEAANIGVALFVPSAGWSGVKLSSSLERVRRFFHPGQTELRRIALASEALKQRIETNPASLGNESEFSDLIQARADPVRLTAPRFVRAIAPRAVLDSLFSTLVGDGDLAKPADRVPLPPSIASAFGRLQAAGKLWTPGSVIVPTIERPLDIAGGYQNGRMNLVRAESFCGKSRLEQKIEKLGFKGRLIYTHPIENVECQLIIVSADPAAEISTEQKFQRVLSEFNVELIPHASTPQFAERLEQEAH